jgi:kynurenine formamidase
MPNDLAVTAAAQGATVGEGDIVLLRTGRFYEGGQASPSVASSEFTDEEARRDRLTGHGSGRMAGWHAACMPWLHERQVSMLGCDFPQDVIPPSYEAMTGPVHTLGLVAMGMPLLDNCDLEELASVCAELGRWEFQFVVTPLRIAGATGAPVNPVAVF